MNSRTYVITDRGTVRTLLQQTLTERVLFCLVQGPDHRRLTSINRD